MFAYRSSKEKEDEQIDGDLTKGDYPMLNSFFQMFPPAANLKQSTLQLSTTEIQDRIGQHSGTWFPAESLYNWLNVRGYKLDTLGGGEFVWLLGEDSFTTKI